VVTYRIATYKVFISHRYQRSGAYVGLTRILDRAGEHDPTWRWENLSIPVDAPIMTEDEAKYANIYLSRIRDRISEVHIVLFILADDWLGGDAESLYLELVEGTTANRYRPTVPIISVLPRGADPGALRFSSPGDITVKWNARSIIGAIRTHALPVSAEELLMTPAETQERGHIVAALAAHPKDLVAAATALGISMSTLRRKRLKYVIR
jgi:Bacterial regulatory protein, Fis family